MSVLVVERFEIVQIEEHHGAVTTTALAGCDGLLQTVIQQPAIGKMGQGVVEREFVDFLFRHFALGNIMGHNNYALWLALAIFYQSATGFHVADITVGQHEPVFCPLTDTALQRVSVENLLIRSRSSDVSRRRSLCLSRLPHRQTAWRRKGCCRYGGHVRSSTAMKSSTFSAIRRKNSSCSARSLSTCLRLAICFSSWTFSFLPEPLISLHLQIPSRISDGIDASPQLKRRR